MKSPKQLLEDQRFQNLLDEYKIVAARLITVVKVNRLTTDVESNYISRNRQDIDLINQAEKEQVLRKIFHNPQSTVVLN